MGKRSYQSCCGRSSAPKIAVGTICHVTIALVPHRNCWVTVSRCIATIRATTVAQAHIPAGIAVMSWYIGTCCGSWEIRTREARRVSVHPRGAYCMWLPYDNTAGCAIVILTQQNSWVDICLPTHPTSILGSIYWCYAFRGSPVNGTSPHLTQRGLPT